MDVEYGQVWRDEHMELAVAAVDDSYAAVCADNSGDEYIGSMLVLPLAFLTSHFTREEGSWHGVDADDGAALLDELRSVSTSP